MQSSKNQKCKDNTPEDKGMDISFQVSQLSQIQNCYQQKKVSLLSEQQLLSDKSFYIKVSIQQIPNHKVYLIIYLMSIIDQEIVTIPHAYIKDFTYFDNQIRFTLKTSLKLFLIPQQTNYTNQIYQCLMIANRSIPFCLNVKFKDQQSQTYDCLAEMQRMLINWKKVVAIDNSNGKQIATYPKIIFAPSKVDKEVVKQNQKSRFNSRIPVLTFYDKDYGVSLWRCGNTIKQQNSKYDYTYLESISQNLLIIEIQQIQNRKQSIYGFNHFGNQIKFSIQRFQSLYQVKLNYQRLIQSYLKNQSGFFKILDKWYEEIDCLLKCSFKCAEHIHNKRHVLIQENDNSKIEAMNNPFLKGGIDRGCQLSAVTQIILDPYYRSIKGFCVLIQKQFVSFGYPFHTRCGYDRQDKNDSSPKKQVQTINLMSSIYRQANNKINIKSNQISPTLIQFLQCISQLINCFPHNFQYSSQFLAHIGYQLFSGKFNNFLFNTIHQKQSYPQIKNTQSLYRYIAMKKKYYNIHFKRQRAQKNLLNVRSCPRTKQYLIWKEYWNIVTKMNCSQNQIEDFEQIKEFKKLVERKVSQIQKVHWLNQSND